MSIRAEGLCVHYGDHCALHDFDLDVQPGEFVGLVGPNGGGKTTLLRALLGILPSAHGALDIEGRVAYVAQDAIHTDPHIPATVLEFVSLGRLGRRFWQRVSPTDRARVEEALKETGAWDLRDRRLSDLSGGQRQRAHLAQALCQDANVLLLDEPTTGIDPQSRDDLYQLLHHLCRDHGITVVMISHDGDSLVAMADRIVVVDKTKRFDGPGPEYRTWAATPTTVPTGNPFGAHA